MTDLKHLRKLAEAATPGPWKAGFRTVSAPETEDRLALDVRLYSGNRDDLRINANFIAAANPATILAMLDTIEAQRGLLERARGHMEWASRVLQLSDGEAPTFLDALTEITNHLRQQEGGAK